MYYLIGRVVVPLALLGAATVVQAQSTRTTTTTTIEKTASTKLLPQQRTVIYRTVTRERRGVPPSDVQVGRSNRSTSNSHARPVA
jgi:hypothetical protein